MSDRAEGGPRITINPEVKRLAEEIQQQRAKELAERGRHHHEPATMAGVLTESRRPSAVHPDLAGAGSINSYKPVDVPPLASPVDNFERFLVDVWGRPGVRLDPSLKTKK